MNRLMSKTNKVWSMNSFKIRNILFLLLIVSFSVTFEGCKAKKLAAEKEAQEKMMIENTKNRLRALLDEQNTMTLQEKEKELEDIKELNLTDNEVLDLIDKVERKLAGEREQLARTELERKQQEEEARRKAEEAKRNARTNSLDYNLEQLFNEIAMAGRNDNISRANAKINEALDYFTSPEALVLVIIYQSGDQKDYDEPTTIMKYLNYLKDTKQNKNVIYDIVKDGSGKIKELELIRK